MTDFARVEIKRAHGISASAINGGLSAPATRFEASSEATSAVQETPRAWIANKCLLAMTRLAKPNRLNNCASFLARPL